MGSLIVSEILSTMTAFGSGFATAISSLFSGLLVTGEGASQTLTAFASFSFAMMGISILIGLGALVFKLIKSRSGN